MSEGGPSVLLYRNLEDSRSEGKKGLHMSYNICYNTTFTGGLRGARGAQPSPPFVIKIKKKYIYIRPVEKRMSNQYLLLFIVLITRQV